MENVRLKISLAILRDYRWLKSTDFWKSCLQFSKAKSIGFELSIHKSNITIDEISRTASKLVSSYTVWLKFDDFISHDLFPSFSSFVAASLYYDLCEREWPCVHVVSKGVDNLLPSVINRTGIQFAMIKYEFKKIMLCRWDSNPGLSEYPNQLDYDGPCLTSKRHYTDPIPTIRLLQT
ncbi:hypothetical protein YC2023_048217 [Brassica napus]